MNFPSTSEKISKNMSITFWDLERDLREYSIIVFEDEQTIIRLFSLNNRIYITVKGENIKTISDVIIVDSYNIFAFTEHFVNLGPEKRAFVSMPGSLQAYQKKLISVSINIDGKKSIWNTVS